MCGGCSAQSSSVHCLNLTTNDTHITTNDTHVTTNNATYLGGLPHSSTPRGLTRHANFDHVPAACVTLLRLALGAGWGDMMQDCVSHTTLAAALYFISYVLCVRLLLAALVACALTGDSSGRILINRD